MDDSDLRNDAFRMHEEAEHVLETLADGGSSSSSRRRSTLAPGTTGRGIPIRVAVDGGGVTGKLTGTGLHLAR